MTKLGPLAANAVGSKALQAFSLIWKIAPKIRVEQMKGWDREAIVRTYSCWSPQWSDGLEPQGTILKVSYATSPNWPPSSIPMNRNLPRVLDTSWTNSLTLPCHMYSRPGRTYNCLQAHTCLESKHARTPVSNIALHRAAMAGVVVLVVLATAEERQDQESTR